MNRNRCLQTRPYQAQIGSALAQKIFLMVVCLLALGLAASGARAQTFTTLHYFSYSEGPPTAPLIQASDGNLYGTTEFGGVNNLGTVFKISLSGALTTLHSFNGKDGAGPVAALIQAGDGNLYGTTFNGGTVGQGTVFRFAPNVVLAGSHIYVTPRTGRPGLLVGFFACLLRNSNNTLVGGKTLTFRLDGRLLGTVVTNSTRSAQLNSILPGNISLGTHQITVEFAGDSEFIGAIGTGTLTVSLPTIPSPTFLWVRSVSGKIGQSVPLAAVLQQNAYNVRIADRTLSFAIDGKVISTQITDSQGAGYVNYTIPAGMTAGNHTITVTFAGDAAFAASSGTGTLTINP